MKSTERFAKTFERFMNFTERFVKTLERMFKPQELLCGMPINKKLSYFEFSITSHMHRDTTVSLTLA